MIPNSPCFEVLGEALPPTSNLWEDARAHDALLRLEKLPVPTDHPPGP